MVFWYQLPTNQMGHVLRLDRVLLTILHCDIVQLCNTFVLNNCNLAIVKKLRCRWSQQLTTKQGKSLGKLVEKLFP